MAISTRFSLPSLTHAIAASLQSTMEKEIAIELHNRIDPIINKAAAEMAAKVRCAIVAYENPMTREPPTVVLTLDSLRLDSEGRPIAEGPR